MIEVAEHIYLLGGQPREPVRFHVPVSKLRRQSEIHQAILPASKHPSAWIATRPDATDDFLREAWATGCGRGGSRRRLGRILLLFPPRPDSVPALEDLFHPVTWGTASFKLLPHEELAAVLTSEDRHDLFIGGFVAPETESLVLYRGDFERLGVPLSIFKAFGDPLNPTSRLSPYSAAARRLVSAITRPPAMPSSTRWIPTTGAGSESGAGRRTNHLGRACVDSDC
jgi:hypothetical protein